MSDQTTNERETEIRERETPESQVADAAERVVGTLFDVGRLWAAHGLSVGRSALETSATTLRTTAALLGDLSRKIEREADEEEAA